MERVGRESRIPYSLPFSLNHVYQRRMASDAVSKEVRPKEKEKESAVKGWASWREGGKRAKNERERERASGG